LFSRQERADQVNLCAKFLLISLINGNLPAGGHLIAQPCEQRNIDPSPLIDPGASLDFLAKKI